MTADNRFQGLTQQLLTFSRDGAPILVAGNLKELIEERSAFIVSGTNVTIKFELDDGLWAVEMDKAQIGQVINNLIINSQHAIPIGGTI